MGRIKTGKDYENFEVTATNFEGKEKKIQIAIVPDFPCPTCGASWGNEDKDLDFPNRQKVDDFWKCYNPDCNTGFYNPFTGEIEEEPGL